MAAPASRTGAPPAWARAFTWTFLGALVVCALWSIEAWPFTGWRLFSHVRRPVVVSRQAWLVDSRGVERPAPFGALPYGYRWATHVLAGFESEPPAARAAVCDAWATAFREAGYDVAAIRMYEMRRDLRVRDDRRAAPAERTREFARCA